MQFGKFAANPLTNYFIKPTIKVWAMPRGLREASKPTVSGSDFSEPLLFNRRQNSCI